jgi:hypothetical protein
MILLNITRKKFGKSLRSMTRYVPDQNFLTTLNTRFIFKWLPYLNILYTIWRQLCVFNRLLLKALLIIPEISYQTLLRFWQANKNCII